MQLVESGAEQGFSEGEPDLEPPEELAVGEIDDDTILEEGLDNEDVQEEDVDDDLLSWTLEDLVHVGEDLEEPATAFPAALAGEGPDEEDLVGVLEVEDLEDLEESLDLLLALKLATAGAGEGPGDPDEGGPWGLPRPGRNESLACGPEEFVCRSCFLVHHRAQLADGAALVCRDCAG